MPGEDMAWLRARVREQRTGRDGVWDLYSPSHCPLGEACLGFSGAGSGPVWGGDHLGLFHAHFSVHRRHVWALEN